MADVYIKISYTCDLDSWQRVTNNFTKITVFLLQNDFTQVEVKGTVG